MVTLSTFTAAAAGCHGRPPLLMSLMWLIRHAGNVGVGALVRVDVLFQHQMPWRTRPKSPLHRSCMPGPFALGGEVLRLRAERRAALGGERRGAALRGEGLFRHEGAPDASRGGRTSAQISGAVWPRGCAGTAPQATLGGSALSLLRLGSGSGPLATRWTRIAWASTSGGAGWSTPRCSSNKVSSKTSLPRS